MNTIQDFTAKLDKINWTKFDDNSLMSEDGFKVSYFTDLKSFKSTDSPRFQIVIRVIYNNSYIMSWGCESYEDQDFFGEWFIKNEAKVRDNEFKQSNKNQSVARAIFDSL